MEQVEELNEELDIFFPISWQCDSTPFSLFFNEAGLGFVENKNMYDIDNCKTR